MKIAIVKEEKCYIIKVENSLAEVPKKTKHGFVSTKSELRGYGLKSIEDIVNKYDGIMTCTYDENKFSVVITFY